MGKNAEVTVLKLKEKIKALKNIIETEPVILLKGSGDILISDKAHKIISEKKLDKTDFLGWLKIGAAHLLNTRYCCLDVALMRFPDDSKDVLVVLKEAVCKPENKKCNLTVKEKGIIEFLIKGMTNKEIAVSLNISPETVNAHLDNIYNKFGVSNRLTAAFAAIKEGHVAAKDIPSKPKR
ncbi:MAG: LuxR family transcriptional regulator [Nitrospirae bacterium]|nr:MAG: LuxR family transcriptional regulator [Nitrospirota bacterium]